MTSKLARASQNLLNSAWIKPFGLLVLTVVLWDLHRQAEIGGETEQREAIGAGTGDAHQVHVLRNAPRLEPERD